MWWQHHGFRNRAGDLQHVEIGVVLNDWMPDHEKEQDHVAAFQATVLAQTGQGGKVLYTEHGYAKVGAEVFVLGFPLGLALQGTLPIWKRGSIASEPLIAIDGNLPIFFAMLSSGTECRARWSCILAAS